MRTRGCVIERGTDETAGSTRLQTRQTRNFLVESGSRQKADSVTAAIEALKVNGTVSAC